MRKMSSAFKSAWEAFEVGNFKEIETIFQSHPLDIEVMHLYSIAYYLENSKLPVHFETSHLSENSILQPLLKSMYFQKKFNYKDAFSLWKQFFLNSKNYLTSPILSYGVHLSIDAEEYTYALELIQYDKSFDVDSYYAEPKLHALYYLKKFPELLQHYQKNNQFIPENSKNFFMIGMTLLYLRKYREAEYFLKKFTPAPLPRFEEIQQEMLEKIQKIPLLEKKPNLNLEELKELGFAYLFTKQYQKAERVLKLVREQVA